MPMNLSFQSKTFEIETLDLGGGITEQIIRGGRNLFPLLPQAFEGVKRVFVREWAERIPRKFV